MLRHGFYNFLGNFTRLIVSVISTPILIRSLGIENYGLWTLISSALVVVGLAEGGLSASTTFFTSRALGRGDKDDLMTTLTMIGGAMFVLATLIFTILFFISPILAASFPNLSDSQRSIVSPTLRWGSIAIWCRMMQGIFGGTEQAYEKYALNNLLNTLQGVFANIGMMLLAWWGANIIILMQWQVLVGIITLVSHTWLTMTLLEKTNHKIRIYWRWSKGLEIARYSCSVWITSIGNVLFSQFDKIIVGALLGSKLLGVYSAITSVCSQINTFSATVVQPILPKLSNLASQDNLNSEEFKNQIKQAYQVNAGIAFGMGGALLIISPILSEFIFKQDYSDIYLLAFKIGIIIYTLYSISGSAYYILLGLGLSNLLMRVIIACSLLSLVLIYGGSYFYGLLGAVFGNSGFIAIFLLNLIVFKKLCLKIGKWFAWIKIHIVIFTFVCIIEMYWGIYLPTWLRFGMLTFQAAFCVITFLQEQKFSISKILKV
ncbi:MAG: oligosaccharide flippase family protein [Richelia sp. RM2_1_2]|nr:oligosaccharide flippase family protein [Richelia sp. RM1_1_1]NJO62183.1 oligosaccharide flippase family protein [Richelia sp. RM2_1_2]